jgi:osmotically-inducible protein OsmY
MARLGKRLAGVLVVSLFFGWAAWAAQVGSEPEPQGAETQVSDALLELKVKLALLEHLRDDGLVIQTRVADGVVWLTGVVDERASFELVSEVVKAVEGVKEVKNDVRLEERKSDAPVGSRVAEAEREVHDGLLEAKVKARLFESVGRAAFGIEVEAAQGIVTLSGRAPDRDSRKSAVKAAKNTKGVRRVVDLLQVRAE